MSDVKRYEWDEDDGDWYCEGFTPVAGDALIRASDYDALAARLAEEQERLDFLQGFLFTRRWMTPIGSPFTWELVGHWRHQIKDLKGETFRGAIDAARAADSAGEKP